MSSTDAINTFDLGDDVVIRGQWKTQGGEFVDPDEVFVMVKSPEPGVAQAEYKYGVDAEVVKEAAGKYKSTVDANYPGRWFYKWYSTGEGKAAGEREFVVARSQFS